MTISIGAHSPAAYHAAVRPAAVPELAAPRAPRAQGPDEVVAQGPTWMRETMREAAVQAMFASNVARPVGEIDRPVGETDLPVGAQNRPVGEMDLPVGAEDGPSILVESRGLSRQRTDIAYAAELYAARMLDLRAQAAGRVGSAIDQRF